MNPFLAWIVRVIITVPVAVTVWLVSFFGFDQTFLTSSFISIAGAFITYFSLTKYYKFRYLKKQQLTRKEFQYITKNLEEAKRKIFRLQKALISIRHIPSMKQRLDLIRVSRKIYSLTKKEPKRFYKAEQFYFSHLDSAVELAEKYVLLSNQPVKSKEMELSLLETNQTLKRITNSIEHDLYKILSDDIDDLHYELDVVKHTIKPNKTIEPPKESRR